jgi:hypothetical protein
MRGVHMREIREISYQPAGIRGGYTDRILRINLDREDISIQELPSDFKTRYIGGRGYGMRPTGKPALIARRIYW